MPHSGKEPVIYSLQQIQVPSTVQRLRLKTWGEASQWIEAGYRCLSHGLDTGSITLFIYGGEASWHPLAHIAWRLALSEPSYYRHILVMSPPFLAQFPDFKWDPTAPLLENFGRLADQEGWSKKGKAYKKNRREFLAEAVVVRFLDAFGKNVSSLQAWQSLCKTIGVPETRGGEDPTLLTSIKACQNVCCRTGVISPPSVFADVSVVYRPSTASTLILSISWTLVRPGMLSRGNSALKRNWPSTFARRAKSLLKGKRKGTHSFPDSWSWSPGEGLDAS